MSSTKEPSNQIRCKYRAFNYDGQSYQYSSDTEAIVLLKHKSLLISIKNRPSTDSIRPDPLRETYLSSNRSSIESNLSTLKDGSLRSRSTNTNIRSGGNSINITRLSGIFNFQSSSSTSALALSSSNINSERIQCHFQDILHVFSSISEMEFKSTESSYSPITYQNKLIFYMKPTSEQRWNRYSSSSLIQSSSSSTTTTIALSGFEFIGENLSAEFQKRIIKCWLDIPIAHACHLKSISPPAIDENSKILSDEYYREVLISFQQYTSQPISSSRSSPLQEKIQSNQMSMDSEKTLTDIWEILKEFEEEVRWDFHLKSIVFQSRDFLVSSLNLMERAMISSTPYKNSLLKRRDWLYLHSSLTSSTSLIDDDRNKNGRKQRDRDQSSELRNHVIERLETIQLVLIMLVSLFYDSGSIKSSSLAFDSSSLSLDLSRWLELLTMDIVTVMTESTGFTINHIDHSINNNNTWLVDEIDRSIDTVTLLSVLRRATKERLSRENKISSIFSLPSPTAKNVAASILGPVNQAIQSKQQNQSTDLDILHLCQSCQDLQMVLFHEVFEANCCSSSISRNIGDIFIRVVNWDVFLDHLISRIWKLLEDVLKLKQRSNDKIKDMIPLVEETRSLIWVERSFVQIVVVMKISRLLQYLVEESPRVRELFSLEYENIWPTACLLMYSICPTTSIMNNSGNYNNNLDLLLLHPKYHLSSECWQLLITSSYSFEKISQVVGMSLDDKIHIDETTYQNTTYLTTR